jgi:acetate kinase
LTPHKSRAVLANRDKLDVYTSRPSQRPLAGIDHDARRRLDAHKDVVDGFRQRAPVYKQFAVETKHMRGRSRALCAAAALGGLDALVFTGGIGENDAATRREVANGCSWLGLTLDAAANDKGETRINARGSRVAAFVIPTNEELEIAKRAWKLSGGM